MKAWDLPIEVDERLWEWAHFFRDRRRLERCRSIENRYRAVGDDREEGWGDAEAAPESRPTRLYIASRALHTHEVIQQLDRKYKWAITYGFCYPHLPRFVVLRAMKKFTGSRLTWKAYLDVLDIGRIRVAATLSSAI